MVGMDVVDQYAMGGRENKAWACSQGHGRRYLVGPNTAPKYIKKQRCEIRKRIIKKSTKHVKQKHKIKQGYTPGPSIKKETEKTNKQVHNGRNDTAQKHNTKPQ